MNKNWMKTVDVQTWQLKDRAKALAVSGAITATIAIGVLTYQNSFSYQLYFNGQNLGYVSEQMMVEDALAEIEKQLIDQYGEDFFYEKEITFEKVRVDKSSTLEIDSLTNALQENIQVFQEAAVIMVDGEEKLILATVEEANEILEQMKKPYVESLAGSSNNIEILDIAFEQDVEVILKNVQADLILDEVDALERVNINTEEIQTYKVAQGDSAWTISRSYGTGLRTLEEANPDKNLEELMPGDTINLSVEKPFLDVSAMVKETVSEKISYATEKKKDSSLFIGQTKVEQEGKNGEKEVTKEVLYVNGVAEKSKVINEKVIAEPIAKIVLEGTKSRPVVTASRSTSASSYKSNLGSSIVATARQYLGTPYRSGGSTPAGFDCSGFTQYVFRQLGIGLPRTSGGQRSVGGFVAKSDLMPGDLVVFSGHVGIYVGNGNMIHSPRPGRRVEITSINTAYWRAKYISGRRAY
ncbi:C40 family peptidase [Alkalibacter saccharofermentans]|uniref:Cell wall-associated hydrolase, NlpC family n=1 Tax=Alkalibacter saccharofermentans DSM 14828 TaxID=1120975 RepID=A0A1M4SG50_9FIRM|nr:C40 family peptidase [Alkalibacter saccharofermentans]SHE31180.1 Cell wall-associated hydrolase, NlpC family [Alkalibacter saccharofermentans DSM 14828]